MSAPEQMTKARLLEEIRAERARLEALLAGIDEGQMLLPGVNGRWSVKDVLAHIVVWEERMIHWLGENARGETPQMLPPGMTWDDIDQMNEQTYLEHRNRPLAEVQSAFRASYPQAVQAVEAVPEADLIEAGRFAWFGNDPLWHLVAANTSWHYAQHAKAVRAWLEKQGSAAAKKPGF
jgi:hypothetical protein